MTTCLSFTNRIVEGTPSIFSLRSFKTALNRMPSTDKTHNTSCSLFQFIEHNIFILRGRFHVHPLGLAINILSKSHRAHTDSKNFGFSIPLVQECIDPTPSFTFVPIHKTISDLKMYSLRHTKALPTSPIFSLVKQHCMAWVRKYLKTIWEGPQKRHRYGIPLRLVFSAL